MTRGALLSMSLVLCAVPAAGQDIEPRSADYGFTTTIDDARAVWINPAGLAAFTEASIMGEISFERPLPQSDPFAVGQWTVGFNSRGFAFAYQKDLHAFLSNADAFRFGVAMDFGSGAAGLAVTAYRSDDNTERGIDVGVRLDPGPGLTVGAVVRHVGRPTVRTIRMPVTGVAGASWTPVPTHVQLAGEVLATEKAPGEDGFDVTYRAGGRISTRGRLPMGVIAAFDLGSNLRIDRWTVGIALGGKDQVVAVGSVVPLVGGTQHLRALSVAGVATRRPAGRQF